MKAAKLNLNNNTNESMGIVESKEVTDINIVSMIPYDFYTIEKENTKIASLVYLIKTSNDELITIYKPYNFESELDEDEIVLSSLYHTNIADIINIKTVINSTPTYISEININYKDGEGIFDAYNVADQNKMARCHIDLSIMSGVEYINNNIVIEAQEDSLVDDSDFEFAICQCIRNDKMELFEATDVKEILSIYIEDSCSTLFSKGDTRKDVYGFCYALLNNGTEDMIVKFETEMNLSVNQIKKIRDLSKDETKEYDGTYYSCLYDDNVSITINDTEYNNVSTSICKSSENESNKKYLVLSNAMEDLLKKKIYEF